MKNKIQHIKYTKNHATDIPTFTFGEKKDELMKNELITVFGGRTMFGKLLPDDQAASFGFGDGLGALYLKAICNPMSNASYQLHIDNITLDNIGTEKIASIMKQFSEQSAFNSYIGTLPCFSLSGKEEHQNVINNIRDGQSCIMTSIQLDLIKENVLDFHDKNCFAQFLKEGNYFPTPKTINLNHLDFSSPGIFEELNKIAQNQMNVDIEETFLKLAILGGGFGVADGNSKQGIKDLIVMYLQQKNEFIQGIQLQEKVPQPSTGMDSPCITSDHLSDGSVDMLSSSQLLIGPVYVGNQYEKRLHDELLENLDPHLDRYFEDLLSCGVYFGGTDFIKNKDSEYVNIVDPNYGRYNGSSAMRYIKNLLESNGVLVDSAFTGKLSFKTDDFKSISTVLEAYKFDGKKGLILIPHAISAFMGKDSTDLKFVYINNKSDSTYKKFQEEILSEYTKKPVL